MKLAIGINRKEFALDMGYMAALVALLVIATWKLVFASGGLLTAESVRFTLDPTAPAKTAEQRTAKVAALEVESRIQQGIAADAAADQERELVAAMVPPPVAAPPPPPPSVTVVVPPAAGETPRPQEYDPRLGSIEWQMANHLEEVHRAEGRIVAAVGALSQTLSEKMADSKASKAETDARLEAAILRIAEDVDANSSILWGIAAALGLGGVAKIPAMKRYVQTGDRRASKAPPEDLGGG